VLKHATAVLGDTPEFFPVSARLAQRALAETDPGIPLHLSRYFPAHRATAPPTPPDRLAAAYRIARERLPYVYVGNVRLPGAEDTVCPECHATVIRREAYRIDAGGLSGDRCAACGAHLRFVV
jgi:pyruvate formate lyase activating enzyme